MEKTQIVDTLQAAHNEYFRLLMKNYPTFPNDSEFADFGPPELCDLASEVHSCAIALGSSALARLNYVGLAVLYPFDNPVDLYNWRQYVKTSKINHTTYASIAIRIDGELKRFRRALELGGIDGYNALSPDLFLVSKDRYAQVAISGSSNPPSATPEASSIHIETLNITNAVDSAAVSRLEELEKKTTVWSNISNIFGALRPFLGS
jgi:hypothetical protein